MAEEMALTRDVIGVESRRSQFATYLLCEFRRAPFISVEAEDPIVFCGIEREVAEFAEATEFFADNFRAVFPGNFHRPVGAERINDNDFIRPFYALQHITKLPRLVKGERICRDPDFGAWCDGSGLHFFALLCQKKKLEQAGFALFAIIGRIRKPPPFEVPRPGLSKCQAPGRAV